MPRKPIQKYVVFISHSSKDKWIARQIDRLIREKGQSVSIETFLDEKDIAGGESIAESIRDNLRQCSELLVLFSRYSVDRPWVLIEVGAAWGLEKYIVAIIDKVTPEELPDIITPYKAIDLNNFDEYLSQLLKRAESRKYDSQKSKK